MSLHSTHLLALLLSFCCNSLNAFEQPWSEHPEASIVIDNAEHSFDKMAPTFLLNMQQKSSQIRWQISDSEDFSLVFSGLDIIEEAKEELALTKRELAFLECEKEYYFRACALGERGWGEWSEPFSFTLFDGKENVPSIAIDDAFGHSCRMSYLPKENPYKGISLANGGYERPQDIDEAVWEQLIPYFLEYDTKERAALDSIFKKGRVLSSPEAMRKAGFLLISPKSKIIVARHYKMRNYLIKAYLDRQDVAEWVWWKRRIDGIRLITQSIEKHHYADIVKVPRKWIYPLPADCQGPKEGHFKRNFILIVEDMSVLDQVKNRKAYKSKLTRRHADALYTILSENHLIDSVYADNVPFCEDGKLAFIDTEHANDFSRPVPYETFGHIFNGQLRAYWQSLINRGGP